MLESGMLSYSGTGVEEEYVNGVMNHRLPDNLNCCQLLMGPLVFTLCIIRDLSISHFL